MNKWDERFIEMAKLVASWSKDPSTQVGAVIVRPDRTVASVGYNGFPRYMSDDTTLYVDRNAKYSRVIHAEMNALMHSREPLFGYTIYTWPMLTCERCAVHVIQAGIQVIKAPICPTHLQERWAESLEKARAFYEEAALQVKEL